MCSKIINKKNLSTIILLLLFLVPPAVGSYFHIKEISTEKYITTQQGVWSFDSISEDVPKNKPTNIDVTKYKLETDENLKNELKDISRYSALLDIQPNIIRHTISIKNTVSAQINYLEDPNGNTQKKGMFGFTLSCMGIDMEQSQKPYKIKGGLILNDEQNNDRTYLTEIIDSCFNPPFGGFKNNVEKLIYINKDLTFTPAGEISLIIKPD